VVVLPVEILTPNELQHSIMALIGRVETDDQPGQRALEAVPDMMLRLEDIRSAPDEAWRVIFWATGDEFELYESALVEDPEVVNYERLTELPDRRLYRVTSPRPPATGWSTRSSSNATSRFSISR
jgi:hypothetical protein